MRVWRRSKSRRLRLRSADLPPLFCTANKTTGLAASRGTRGSLDKFGLGHPHPQAGPHFSNVKMHSLCLFYFVFCELACQCAGVVDCTASRVSEMIWYIYLSSTTLNSTYLVLSSTLPAPFLQLLHQSLHFPLLHSLPSYLFAKRIIFRLFYKGFRLPYVSKFSACMIR